MRADEIDHILSGERRIEPATRFVASVMEAVRVEATTPPPIPFPWARALPGVAAAGAAVVALTVAAVRGSGAGQPPLLPVETEAAFRSAAASPDAAWVLAASLLLLAAVRVSWRPVDSY